MATKPTPKPPGHLKSTDARRLWRRTVEAYGMSEHHLALLEQGCKALDRLVEAREVIDRDGIAIPDRYGVLKQHPACAIERDQRIALVRIIRELNLDEEEEHVRGPGRSW